MSSKKAQSDDESSRYFCELCSFSTVKWSDLEDHKNNSHAKHSDFANYMTRTLMRSLGVVEASPESLVAKKKKTSVVVPKKEKSKVVKAKGKLVKVSSGDVKPLQKAKVPVERPSSTAQSSDVHANYANYVTRKLVKSLDPEGIPADIVEQPQHKAKLAKVKKSVKSVAKRKDADASSKIVKKQTVQKVAKNDGEPLSPFPTNAEDDKHSAAGDAVNYVTRTLMKTLCKPAYRPNLPIQQSPKDRVQPVLVSPTSGKNLKKHSIDELVGQSETDESLSSPEGKAFSPIKSQITKMIFKTKPKAAPVVSKTLKANEHDSVNYVTRTLLKSLKEPVEKKKISLPLKEAHKVAKKVPVEDNGVNYVTRTLIKNICTSPEANSPSPQPKKAKKSNHVKETVSKSNVLKIEPKEESFAQESANYVTRHLVKSISKEPVKPKKKLELPIKPRVNGKPKDDLFVASLSSVGTEQPVRKRKSSFLASFYDDSDSDDDDHLQFSSTKATAKKPRVKKTVQANLNQTDKQSVKSRLSASNAPGVKHGKKWFNLPSAITVDEKFDLFLQNSSSTPSTATLMPTTEPFSFKNASDISGDSDAPFDLSDSEPDRPFAEVHRKPTTPKARPASASGGKKTNHVSSKRPKVTPSTSKKKKDPKPKKSSTKKPNQFRPVTTAPPPKASVPIEEQFDSDCAVYVTRRLLKNLPM